MIDYNTPVKPTLAGQLLVWLRQNKGTIRRRCLEAKVDNGTISRWMLGKAVPYDSTIQKMAATAKLHGFVFIP